MTSKRSRPLFSMGDYLLHSGDESTWKINCDSLGEEDWCTLAYLLSIRLPPFSGVYGIPRGGVALATALLRYVTRDQDDLPDLVVDDVLSTGASFIKWKNSYQRPCIGAVIFARDAKKVPDWVTPLFIMTPERKKK